MGSTFSAAVLGVVAVALLWYAWGLRRRYVAAQSELSRERAKALELNHFNQLLRKVTEADWQQYPAVLVKEIVTQGYAARAVLLVLGEHGRLDVRTTASADGSVWDPRPDSAVQTALSSRQRVWHGDTEELFLPIPEQGEPIGILAAGGVRFPGGSRDQSSFLEATALLAQLTLTNQRMLTRQTSLSTTDGLTGLHNHRHFQQVLSVVLAQSYLEHTFMAMVMLDIDHFKKLNDTHGHLFGDLVLREMGGVIRRTVPGDAITARYGGEEFAVVLPGYSIPEATEVAEKLRAAIAAHTITEPTSGNPVSVTISGGVAAYSLGMGKSRLIARADEALYMSKQNGRNQITVAPPEPADDAALVKQ